MCAPAFEHGPVFLIDDLDAQPFGGHVDQNLVAEFLQTRVGVDHILDIRLQGFELFDFLETLKPKVVLRRSLEIDDFFERGKFALFDLASAARQVLAASLDDAGAVAASGSPNNATLSGVLKYSDIPIRSPFVVEPNNHISRKNAIIAVTKSA